MQEAERCGLLVVEQYGSCQHKDAITQCLNKCLWYDYIRCTRQPAALCSNDAKSCYDRIVLLIAALCMCRLGAEKESVLSMMETIRGMHHHTRTVHGDSTRFASRQTWNQPVAGIGQGNGAGPAIWAAVSSPLFEIMQEDGFLATVICAMSLLECSFTGFAFVDDTDLCVSGQTMAATTVQCMQGSVTNWEGLLRTTGGALVPDKCFWYLIDQYWSDGHWAYRPLNHTSGELKVVDAHGHLHVIPRLDVTKARCTLGVRLAPDGNSMAEFKYLWTTANEWKKQMETARLTHTDALFSLRSSILRKMAYPLAVTTFTEKQCAESMKPILSVGLPKIGCIWSMPWAVVHGPIDRAGLNIPNLYTEQAVTQLVMLLRFGSCSSDQTRILLHALMELMKLETGLVGEPWTAPGIFAPLVTDTWLKRLWLDCLRHQIEIHTDLPQILPPRIQDAELIRTFIDHGYHGQELRELNWCRMSLHAIWISDICDGTGSEILADCWNGQGTIESPYRWPPTFTQLAYWSKWQQALTKCFGLDRWRQLSHPLGKWLPTTSGWFYERTSDRLWHCDMQGWQYHPYLPSRSRTQYFTATGYPSSSPPLMTELRRVVAVHRGPRLLLAGYDTILESTNTYRGIDVLRHSQLAQDWNLCLHTVGSLSALITDIRKGHGYIVSDGSYRNNASAAAWIIEGRDATCRIIGMMITPGYETDHSSFCSKLMGLYGALCTLEVLDLGPMGTPCRIACDGKSALDRVQSTNPIQPTEPHADILQAIRAKASSTGSDFQWHHVKGHQDCHTPMVLSRDAWLNIKADILAKAAVNPEYQGPEHYHLPGEGWTCSINHRRIVTQLADRIRNQINDVPITKYWKTKFGINNATWQSIDWIGLGRAYRESTITVWRWATKHTSGFFAHGKNMARWNFRSSMHCPRCGTENEDKAHITQCPAPAAREIWQHSLKKLTQWLRDSNTAHEISEAIVWGLNQWIEPGQSLEPPGGQFVSDQTLIGWNHFLDGWLAQSWRLHQEGVWQLAKSQRSSRRWVAELIKKLWNVSWDMWAHRNGILHESPTARQDILEKKVNDRICKLYMGGTQALPRDAIGLFRKPKEHILKLALPAKQQWIESVQVAIDQKKRHEFGAYLSEQRFMATWVINR